MLRKLALSVVGALSLAAPVAAVPIQIPVGLEGQTAWMFSPQTAGGEETYFVEVIRQDSEGDILIELTDMTDRRLSYAWIDCDQDLISYNGGEWSYVDHRKHEGWYSDIACNRPLN